MRSLLMETGKRIDFFGKYEKTQSLRSNPILDWMDHKIVFFPNARTVVGFCRTNQGGISGYYDNKDTWLYASYAEFCRNSNVNIMSRGRFWPLFLDICSHQLKLKVFGKKNVAGMHIFNVAIRESNVDKFKALPSIVEFAANPDKYKEEYPELFVPTSEKMEDDASM